MPSDAILALIKGLRDPSRDVRYRSAYELSDFGDEARLAVPSLIQAVQDEDEWVASWSADALARVHPVAEEAIPVLIKRLGDENHRVGLACQEALERMGHAAVPALLGTLKDRSERARELSAWALCRATPVSAEVIAALINALGDSQERVRNASAKALGIVGRPALPALVSALKHENEWVRAKSAFAIGRVGLDARRAVPVLMNSLRDTSRRVRSKSAQALNRIRALEEEEKQERVRTQAKKSSEANADVNHCGQAGPRRERFKGPEIITRVRDAVRVLAGVRSAEVAFDELDRLIGDMCAAAAADKITALLAPDTDDMDAYDDAHRKVTRFVLEAIENYASYEAWYGRDCRESMRIRRARQTPRQEQGQSAIPF